MTRHENHTLEQLSGLFIGGPAVLIQNCHILGYLGNHFSFHPSFDLIILDMIILLIFWNSDLMNQLAVSLTAHVDLYV